MRTLSALKVIFVFGIFNSALAIAAPEQPKKIYEHANATLRCTLDKELEVEVKTKVTALEYEGVTFYRMTGRSIKIAYNNITAFSETASPPIPKDLDYKKVQDFPFLTDSYSDKNGVQYEYQSDIYRDKQKRAFPVHFMRLRAQVPVEKQTKDKWGNTLTHYSINLALPEVRTWSSKGFGGVNGYLNYWYNNKINDDRFPDGLTIGLAPGMTCWHEYKKTK